MRGARVAVDRVRDDGGQATTEAIASPARNGRASTGTALGVAWLIGALLALVVATRHLDGAVPVFTAIWLVVPLVTLLRRRDAGRVGLRRVRAPRLAGTTVLAAVLAAALTLAVEPWSGAYGALVEEALATDPVDTTFGWLVVHDGPGAWAAFVLFGGLVTIFAEELFFRGWLLQLLLRHTDPARAVVAQAALFSVVQVLPALLLAPLEGVVFVGAYAFALVGVVGGWAAWRTASIWPSLAVAATLNALLTALVA